MKGFMDFLARAKLVELSDEEKQAAIERSMLAESAPVPGTTGESPAAPDLATAEAPPEPLPVLSAAELGVEEGKSFAEIFAAAGIPPSPFPAEKLLRLLDGLRTMDAATRKAAVLAMDAADDSWEITDSVNDAQQKITALGDYKQVLAAQLQGREQQVAAQVAEVRTGLDAATAAIRQQIAELEQLLERKITQSAQETTSIEAELRATREAVARELRRTDAEIERLREIPSHFIPAAPAAN